MKEFESIWQEYERELSTFVLSRVQNKEVQKEIMQEVALKIFISLHQQQEHLRGWLYKITKNCIYDYYRKEQKNVPDLDFEEELDEHLMLECLNPMMSKLTVEAHEILEFIYFKELSLDEASQKLNIPVNTAKSRLQRAKKSLSQIFFSCCNYELNHLDEIVDYTPIKQQKCIVDN